MQRVALTQFIVSSALACACSVDETIVLGRIEDGSVTDPSASGGATSPRPIPGEAGAGGGGASPQPEPENLLVNGDFADGAAGFQTGYLIVDSGVVNEGEIAVTDQPQLLHRGVEFDVDDISGEGFMLMVNSTFDAEVPFYEQSISLESGQRYRFSVWIRTWWESNLERDPRIELRLDGVVVGVITEGVALVKDVWTELSVEWQASTAGSSLLGLVNANIETTGNDFFLDSAAVYRVDP